jgi:hypothetical protein
MNLYYISFDGEQTWKTGYETANSLHAAKIKGSKNVEYGMHITILDSNKEPIYFRRFWSNLNHFGWEKWKRIGE